MRHRSPGETDNAKLVEAVHGKHGYGVPVDTDEVSSALESTRLLRLALNVLWDELPDEEGAGPVRDALETIHDRINRAESAELRKLGLAG